MIEPGHSDRLLGVDILVLAGGLATRLDGVIDGVPKILAPVAGRPFLDHLLHWLAQQGAHRVLLALGYRAEPVLRYLDAHRFPSLNMLTVVEPRPLGTAGAIGFALPKIEGDTALVLNGDTFVRANLREFVVAHRKSGADASILCVRVDDPGRYGTVEIDTHSRVARFTEKSHSVARSWINAGAYLLSRSVLDQIANLREGSLERDVLERMPSGSINAFMSDGAFLDIGTPESLAAASAFLAEASA